MTQSTRFHGGVRGGDTPKLSSQFEGRFGRMFRHLPPAKFNDDDLKALAGKDRMLAEPEMEDGKPAAAPETENDAEENFDIPAGYTYLGQFIDHDITFDPMSSLVKMNDPEALTDFRTPRLDLDCLYGRGPEDQPYMYTEGQDGFAAKFLLGRPLTMAAQASTSRDLPRLNGRAVIGDKRNDENVIVSQLHGVMLRFHNRLVDMLPRGTPFQKVQQEVRWHYQYLLINDFLPRICGAELIREILPHFRSGHTIYQRPPQLHFYRWKNEPFIPVEFSVAAYRFGHSMVRPLYRLSQALNIGGAGVGEHESLQGRFLVFAGAKFRALNGFREFPADWAIDWKLYFGETDKIHGGPGRVQPAYKIDASLVNPLGFLPEFSDGTLPPDDRIGNDNLHPKLRAGEVPNLALRNLRRGHMMGLPSGQDVARAMGQRPLPPERILIGKAAFEDGELEAKPIAEIAPRLAHKTPLWAYVLAEGTAGWLAEVERRKLVGDAANLVGTHLGPVGGRIVAETLIGLMLADGYSFLRQDPAWLPWASAGAITPDPDFTFAKLLASVGSF